MGKMKELLIEREEEVDGQEGQQDDDLSLCEEAHYYHVINDFVSLIDEHGCSNVIGDVRAKLVARDGWSPC